MTRIRGSARPAGLFLLFALLAGALPAAFGQSQKTIQVANAKDFLKAIGPNRILVLKKGDYKLSTAYDVTSEYVSWNEAEDGSKELALSNLENLTIRGADGVRLVTESGESYLLGIYGGSRISVDNVAFVRQVADDVEVSAGTVYAEGVKKLLLDRCGFLGRSGYPLELWECEGVTLKRLRIENAQSGALYAGYTKDLELSASSVRDSQGYPLVYLEESDAVRIVGTTFEANYGGNFVEIHAEEGYVEEVGFSDCVFRNNEFEYFLGTEIFPFTDGCTFEGNSFGEDWAENSVGAYAGDEGYGEDEGPAYYVHYEGGFAFSYPWEWELESEGEGSDRLALYASDEDALALYASVMPVPAKVDPAKQGKKLFADAFAAYVKLLKDEAGLAVAAKAEGEPYEAGGFWNADYRGTATRAEGQKAALRVRFFVSKGSVHAFAVMALDESSLDPDTTADFILGSIETAPEE